MSPDENNGRVWRRVSAVLLILLLLVLGGLISACLTGWPVSLVREAGSPPPIPCAAHNGAPRPAAPTPLQTETALWLAAAASNDADAIRVYLDKYPNGIFAEDARARLNRLGKRPSPGTSVTPAPQPHPAPGHQAVSELCGPAPAAPVIPPPGELSGRTPAEAHDVVLAGLREIKSYQKTLAAFRECLVSRTTSDKAALAEARAQSDAQKAELLQQQVDDQFRAYDHSIDTETQVIESYMALHKAYCAMGPQLEGCPSR